jgi:hypothetical protein
MAAAVAQHAAERELFVAGELAAANGPNKLVAIALTPHHPLSRTSPDRIRANHQPVWFEI